MAKIDSISLLVSKVEKSLIFYIQKCHALSKMYSRVDSKFWTFKKVGFAFDAHCMLICLQCSISLKHLDNSLKIIFKIIIIISLNRKKSPLKYAKIKKLKNLKQLPLSFWVLFRVFSAKVSNVVGLPSAADSRWRCFPKPFFRACEPPHNEYKV